MINAGSDDHRFPVEHDRIPEMAGEIRFPPGTTIRNQQDVFTFQEQLLSLFPLADVCISFGCGLFHSRVDPDVPFIANTACDTRLQRIFSGGSDFIQRDIDHTQRVNRTERDLLVADLTASDDIAGFALELPGELSLADRFGAELIDT